MSTVQGPEPEVIQYTSRDGTSINAWLAEPPGQGPFPGMVVAVEAWGLTEHMKDVTRRFAARGYLTITPDLYTREGGPPPAGIAEVIGRWLGTPDARALDDLHGAARWLKDRADSTGKAGIVGFCSGGRYGLLLACESDVVDAVVDCYGGHVVRGEDPPIPTQPVLPITVIDRLSCPFLGIFGEQDQDPTPEDAQKLKAALEKHGKPHEITVYPGAGHAFLNFEAPPRYSAEAAERAWPQIYAWVDRHLR